MSTTQTARTDEHRLTITADAHAVRPTVTGECSCEDWAATARPDSAIHDESMRVMAFSPSRARKMIEREHSKHVELVRLATPKEPRLSILEAARRGPGLLSLAVYVALAVLALVCGMALAGVYGAGPFLLALGMGLPLGFLGAVLGVSRSRP